MVRKRGGRGVLCNEGMPNPVRILLRLFGLLLFLAGLALVVMLFKPGPAEVADWMGDECAHGRNTTGEACTALDVIEITFAAPMMMLIGFVLAITLRPEGRGPWTLDLSRGRRG